MMALAVDRVRGEYPWVSGFGFGAWLSPTDFRVWIPKILWVWGRSLISPVDLHRTSKVQFTRSQTSNPKYISLESSLNLSAQPHPTWDPTSDGGWRLSASPHPVKAQGGDASGPRIRDLASSPVRQSAVALSLSVPSTTGPSWRSAPDDGLLVLDAAPVSASYRQPPLPGT
jgi:hypothetical protein